MAFAENKFLAHTRRIRDYMTDSKFEQMQYDLVLN